jgi:hypothetical protein
MKATVREILAAGTVVLGMIGSAALAHHSGAMFDDEEVRELHGTIKEFQFTNPHTWIQVNVPNENGEVVEWSLEWGSPNQLARRGVRPNTFPPGAEVTVRTNPMKDGSPAGAFIGAKLADGTVVGRWEE